MRRVIVTRFYTKPVSVAYVNRMNTKGSGYWLQAAPLLRYNNLSSEVA